MGWRRRTAWGRRDWIALGVLVGSVAFGVFLASIDVLRVGVRQGLAFLLVFVFIGAAVVPLVRHVPLAVLHFAQPVVFIFGGLVVTVVGDGPVRYLAVGAVMFRVAQLVLQVRARRRLNQRVKPALDKEDMPPDGMDAMSRHE